MKNRIPIANCIDKLKFVLILFLLFAVSFEGISGEKEEIKRLEKEALNAKGDTLYSIKADLSRLYYRYDPQKTMDFAKEVLEYGIAEDKADLIEKAYVRIAIANYVFGKLDSAVYYSEKAILINETTANSEELEYALNLNSLIYSRKGDYLKAIEYGERTLTIRRERNDTVGVAGSLGNIAITYQKIGDYNKSAEYIYESLKIFESLKDTISVVGRMRSLFDLKIRLKLDQDALAILREAISLTKKVEYPLMLAELYSELSHYHRKDNALDSAIHYEDLAFGIYFKHKSILNIATSYLNYAKIYEKMQSLKEARPYYYKAKKLYEENSQIPNLNILLENLGLNYFESNMIDSAKYCFHTAYSSAKDIGQARVVQYTSRDLYGLYKSIKNYDKALMYHEVYTKYNDSLIGIESKQKISELDIQI